jgi:signal transduction histidine kinase
LSSVVGTWFSVGYVLSLVAAYHVGYRVQRMWKVVLSVLLVGILPTIFEWYFKLRHLGPEFDLGMIMVFTVLFATIPTMVGRYARQRVALAHAGWEQARRLERENEMVVEQAKLRERSRIAQDMHDSLGHELSLIALQAGVLELDAGLPERQRETAKLLRSTTSDAVNRLHEIVGVLRDDTDPAPTQPAAEGVSALVDRAAASGVAVTYEESGRPDGGLAPMTDRAIYRIVQESLTNATKHAPGSEVTVRLRHNEDDVLVEVENAPGTNHPDHERNGGGRGLIGLAERVRLAGGRLAAGPREDGGFAVKARLPRRVGTAIAAEEPSRLGNLPRLEPPPEEIARFADYPSAVARLRRSFWFKLVAPIVGLVAFAAAYLFAMGLQMATVHPAKFEALRDGQSQESAQDTMPPGNLNPPSEFGPVEAEPKGQDCRYYSPRTGTWWDFSRYQGDRLYRLCYAGGKLDSHVVLHQKKASP